MAACLFAQSCQPGTTAPPGRSNELAVPSGQVTLRGILIDAGCPDLQTTNLREPPETLQAEVPAQPPNAAQNNPPAAGPISAKGVTVDAATVKAERDGAMESRVPGLFERQADPTCAITGSTTSFALLTDNNRLLDLDAGGNTLAIEAVQSTSGGRAVLNGQGPGVKPQVSATGQIRAGVLITKYLTAGT
jgi:hypothetical protein